MSEKQNSSGEPAGHRWSGWPGAWCLDCGAEDANEICLATHDVILDCFPCYEHINSPCPEAGSKRHDPYSIRRGKNK